MPLDKHEPTPAPAKKDETIVLPPHQPATQPKPHDATATAPMPGPVSTRQSGNAVEEAKALAETFRSGDAQRTWDHCWRVLDRIKAEGQPGVSRAPRASTPDNPSLPGDNPNVQTMKAQADRLDEFVQHCEGGTGHPVARRAMASPGAGWLALLPYIMQVIQALLEKNPPTPPTA